MKPTKEHFDNLLSTLVTKDDLKSILTKDDIKQAINQIKGILITTIAKPMERHCAELEGSYTH